MFYSCHLIGSKHYFSKSRCAFVIQRHFPCQYLYIVFRFLPLCLDWQVLGGAKCRLGFSIGVTASWFQHVGAVHLLFQCRWLLELGWWSAIHLPRHTARSGDNVVQRHLYIVLDVSAWRKYIGFNLLETWRSSVKSMSEFAFCQLFYKVVDVPNSCCVPGERRIWISSLPKVCKIISTTKLEKNEGWIASWSFWVMWSEAISIFHVSENRQTTLHIIYTIPSTYCTVATNYQKHTTEIPNLD